jgi:hypothetical protein
VEFEGCVSIADVSCFQHGVSVSFKDCPNITNVNSLAQVKELVLNGCTGIIDVSAFGNVETMKIDYCENLHDLSALSTVRNLTVYCMNEDLLAPLNQNTVLNISDRDSEGALSSLEFLCCEQFVTSTGYFWSLWH